MLVDIQIDGSARNDVKFRHFPAARRSSRMASARSLSDRLDSPVRNIINLAGNMTRGVEQGLADKYVRFAGDILQAGEHLGRVIANLGASAQPGQDRSGLQPLQVMPVIADALAVSRPLANARQIALEYERQPADSQVVAMADRQRLRQILTNLLSNAVKFSPRGSAVHISLQQDEWVRIIISDEGEGIAPDDRERVFERFERLGRAEEGSGLGLSIARRHAGEMGGRLHVGDSLFGGATFILDLRPA